MRAERGFLLAGRYELTGHIALGGMGEVWRAHDRVLGRAVAVKLLRPEHAGDAAFVARFRDEARHAASLAHPNIATVHDYGEQDGWAYLVMELVAGESLAARLARSGPTGPAPVIAVLGQVGEALAVAHRAGIVHRDVKPANILLTPDGRVKLTDFGIAKAVGARSHTASGVVVGTARYLSPEQATGSPTSPASDVYAMGLVAYEMLAGHPPFTGANDVAVALAQVRDLPPSLPDGVPPALAALIGESLAKDPARRPRDAAAFLTRLAAASAAPDATRSDAEGQAPATMPLGAHVPPVPAGAPRSPAGAEAQPATLVGSPGDGASTAVAPAGFGSTPPPLAPPTPPSPDRSVLGDLPARHRARRRRTAALVGVVTIAALVAGGLLVFRALADDDGTRVGATPGSDTTEPVTTPVPTTPAPTTTTLPPTTTAAPTTTTAPATTTTVPAPTFPSVGFDSLDALIGQDVDGVEPLLELAGIDYVIEYVPSGRKERGTIVEAEADGPLFAGGTLTLYVGSRGGDPPGDGDDDG